jgi:CubicO group peptidase (beta-lactamase class C family)
MSLSWPGRAPADWLADTLAGGEDSAEAFAADEHGADMPGGHYRNQWWVPAGGRVLLAMGIHGQFLFVDREAHVVIALLSTWPTPLDDSRSRTAREAFAATTHALTHGGT